MIRTVIFDLDHTLYDFMDCHEAANEVVFAYMHDHFGIPIEECDGYIRQAMRDVEDKLGDPSPASHRRSLRYQTFLETIGADIFAHTNVMANTYWDTFYEHMQMEESVRKVLDRLHEKGIKIVVATDMQANVQINKINRLGIADVVDALVTSEEANCEKPGQRIHDLCCKKAGCAPEECLFVGDHPVRDVLGAIEHGMEGAWCKHFDTDRFLQAFTIEIDDEKLSGIQHIFTDYADCILPDGRVRFGGITID